MWEPCRWVYRSDYSDTHVNLLHLPPSLLLYRTLYWRHGYSTAHSTVHKCVATHIIGPVSSLDPYRAIYVTVWSWTGLAGRETFRSNVQPPYSCTDLSWLITFWGAKSTMGIRNFNLRRSRVIKRVNIGLNQSFIYLRTPPSQIHPQLTPYLQG